MHRLSRDQPVLGASMNLDQPHFRDFYDTINAVMMADLPECDTEDETDVYDIQNQLYLKVGTLWDILLSLFEKPKGKKGKGWKKAAHPDPKYD